MDNAEIAATLRNARLAAGFSLRHAADAAGIGRSVLSRIERAERPCRVTELVALTAMYDSKHPI